MRRSTLALFCLVVLCACAAEPAAAPDVLDRTGLSWDEFLAGAEREPGPNGVWIVDGDMPLESDKRLVDFYDELTEEGGLTLALVAGRDAAWGSAQKHELTYCVSTDFGERHAAVVEAAAEAAEGWSAVADVTFRHVPEEDARCDADNAAVLFDVRPTSGASYLARAFYPYSARAYRNVLVNDTSFSVRAPLTLAGILRHELGHVLGFRHEHARVESCAEAGPSRELTEYDRASVMHYPHCGGTNHALTLSELDAAGAASVYGPPGAGDAGPRTAAIGTPMSGSARGAVAADTEVRFAPIEVLAGSDFRAVLGGTGDADLYVRFGTAPTLREHDCRPFAEGGEEVCDLAVPEGVREVYLAVRGRTDASFVVELSWMGAPR